MADPNDAMRTTRRHFLVGAAGLAAAGAADARADNLKNLPPNVADWTRQLGEGVGVRSYGIPPNTKRMSFDVRCLGLLPRRNRR